MDKVALLFPGQGAQYVGMGQKACEQSKIADKIFKEANYLLGFDLQALCFEGDSDELTKTQNTQPALLTASIAQYNVLLEETGIIPSFVAGHSLGEFSALVAAEVLTFADALVLVRKRGELMAAAAEKGAGAMAAVIGLDAELVAELCDSVSNDTSFVVVSNNNSPEQLVLSGHSEALERVQGRLTEKGGRVIPLKVSAAFHSPLMQEAADTFKEVLASYEFSTPKIPVISNVTGGVLTGSSGFITELSSQLVQPVQWQPGMAFLQNQGVKSFVDVGPGKVLKNLAVKNVPGCASFSYDVDQDKAKIIEKFPSGKRIVSTVITKCLAAAVSTPNRNWDNNEYEEGVIQPYKKIQELQMRLEESGVEPSVDQARQALDMLQSVFKTKKLPVQEQTDRFNRIFNEAYSRHLFSDFELPQE